MLPVNKNTKLENFMHKISLITEMINIFIETNKYRIIFIIIMFTLFISKCIKNSLFYDYACIHIYKAKTMILLFLDTFTDLIFGYYSVKLYYKTIKSA